MAAGGANNRDKSRAQTLKLIQRKLDRRILELTQLVGGSPNPEWISDQLATLGRERIAVAAILTNRRIEGAKKVVDLTCWFTGKTFLGALLRAPPCRPRKAPATAS